MAAQWHAFASLRIPHLQGFGKKNFFFVSNGALKQTRRRFICKHKRKKFSKMKVDLNGDDYANEKELVKMGKTKRGGENLKHIE